MKHDCIALIDDDGIEIAAGFDYERTEWDDGYNPVKGWYIELQSLEIVIKGVGIDILPSLNEKQQSHIVSLVSEQLDREEAHRVKYPVTHF